MNYEKELKKALKTNNRIALEKIFEDIYKEYHNLVKYIISKYEIDENNIEEILNDVFYNFYKNIFKTEMYNIKYYLVQTAKNLTINHLKKKKEEVSFNEEIVLNEINTYNNTLYNEIIFDMKQKLSENEINIIILHDVYNYTFQELSKKYNKPSNSIKTLYHRAIKKFKEK